MATSGRSSNHTSTGERLWDRLDVLAKLVTAVAAVFIPIAIAHYSFLQGKDSDATRYNQLLIQTIASREQATVQLKAQMFSSLLQNYLEKRDEHDRTVILETIALNFQEEFQLRPLFENWYLHGGGGERQKRELRRIARNISEKQILTIRSLNGGNICDVELRLNTPTKIECAPITLKFVGLSETGVQVTVDDGKPFEVGYFDTPLADHTKMGELNFSLLLSDVDAKGEIARLRCVILPIRYFSGTSKISIDQMLGDALTQVRAGDVKQR
jgi:hypothetical protein